MKTKINPVAKITIVIALASTLTFAAYQAISSLATAYMLTNFIETEGKENLAKMVEHDYRIDLENKIASVLMSINNAALTDEEYGLIKAKLEEQKSSFTAEDQAVFSELLLSSVTEQLNDSQKMTLTAILDNSSESQASAIAYILYGDSIDAEENARNAKNLELLRALLTAVESSSNDGRASQAHRDVLRKIISEAERARSDLEDIQGFNEILDKLKELYLFDESQRVFIDEISENIGIGKSLTQEQIVFLESIADTSNKINISSDQVSELKEVLKANKDHNVLNDYGVRLFERVIEQRDFMTASQKEVLLRAFTEQSSQKIIGNKDLSEFLIKLYENKPDRPQSGIKKAIDTLLKAPNSLLDSNETNYLKSLQSTLQKINILNICVLVLLASALSYLCYKFANASMEKKDLNMLIGAVPELNELVKYDKADFLKPFEIVEYQHEEKNGDDSQALNAASAVNTLIFDERASQYGYSLSIKKGFILMYNEGNETKIFEAKSFPVWIGKGEQCDLVLKSDKLIDDKHAVIFIKDNLYYFNDLNSMSGSKIDGKPASGITLIKNKSIIEVSDTELQLMYE